MSRRKGALTIEASILLPFVIVTLGFILYFMKVYYIQSEIDGAMTRMAHDMSVYAYAFEKTGLVDAQQEALTRGKGLATSEGMDFSNGMVASQISKAMFREYIDDERLRRWGVFSEKGVIDFSASSMMLYDDTIEIIARYRIDLPLGGFIKDGIPIYQSVKVRAFTGSYDGNTSVGKMKAAQEPLFFIATASSDNYGYHVYSCLVKELYEGRYSEHVVDDEKLCIYCKSNYSIPVNQAEKDIYPVYYTSKTSKVHLSKNCPRIRAIKIEAVTREEAENRGYQPCKKHGCVEKTEAQ